MKKIIMLLSLILFLIVLTTGYDQKAEEQSNSQKLQKGTESVTLTISAASSLKDVLEEIKTAYEEEKSNIAITYNFGSSGSLQQQIEQGANVDIFISASVKQMDALKSKELVIEDTLRQFLENEVVLITPKVHLLLVDLKTF
jgi:molybdate transport system substrate-binding protein